MVDGETYFVGKDVASALGYKNTKDALMRHIDEEDKLGERIVMAGQNRQVIIINESGLYALILSSFQRTADVAVQPTQGELPKG
jgi:prophage antirepressor-like protein